MPINSRRKGMSGENELFKLLSHELVYIVKRRLDAPREGGADSLDVPGWSIECKRYARATRSDIFDWMTQAIDQAAATNRKPVLAYRLDRDSWRFVCLSGDVIPGCSIRAAHVEMGMQLWCQIVRESI